MGAGVGAGELPIRLLLIFCRLLELVVRLDEYSLLLLFWFRFEFVFTDMRVDLVVVVVVVVVAVAVVVVVRAGSGLSGSGSFLMPGDSSIHACNCGKFGVVGVDEGV